MAKAIQSDGSYAAQPPEPVGDLPSLIERTNQLRGEHGTALVGFDFPIGLPRQYAKNAGISNFPAFLRSLAPESEFFSVCRDREEISAHRPFYPYNFTPKGSRKREHLTSALGLDSFDQLLRHCERAQEGIPAAGPLFWTLGANAPGRGAIEGWKHVLAPGLRDGSIRLWPYEGRLTELLHPGATVVAEAYPTQYHRSIVGHQISGKNRIEVRQREGSAMLEWAERNSVRLAPELFRTIYAGFPHGGGDAFDAVLGLFGMIEVALGVRMPGPPEELAEDDKIRAIEGWILGRSEA
jgi:hypothetical protein